MMSNLRRRLISWHAGCIDYWYQPNKYDERPIRIHLLSLSTLRRKGRGVLEILAYAVFMLGVVLSIWQFAQTPVKISAPGLEPCVACHTTTTPPFVRS